MSKLSSLFNQNRFAVISWTVTIALVAGMIGGALKWKQISSVQALAPIPTAGPDKNKPNVEMPPLLSPVAFQSIEREIQLKTSVPADKPRLAIAVILFWRYRSATPGKMPNWISG